MILRVLILLSLWESKALSKLVFYKDEESNKNDTPQNIDNSSNEESLPKIIMSAYSVSKNEKTLENLAAVDLMLDKDVFNYCNIHQYNVLAVESLLKVKH